MHGLPAIAAAEVVAVYRMQLFIYCGLWNECVLVMPAAEASRPQAQQECAKWCAKTACVFCQDCVCILPNCVYIQSTLDSGSIRHEHQAQTCF